MRDEKSGKSEYGDPANAAPPLILKEIARRADRQARARALWDHLGQWMMALASAHQASRAKDIDGEE